MGCKVDADDRKNGFCRDWETGFEVCRRCSWLIELIPGGGADTFALTARKIKLL
jgi:hypothetical protein